MNRRPRVVRHAVRSLVVAGAVAATAVAGAVPAGAATRPALTLEASRSSVTVYRYSDGDEAFLDGDLGVYAVADAKQAFEVRAERRDYDHPVVARLVRKGRDRTLPAPPDLSGLANFSRTTFRDSKGKVVTTSTSAFCPDVYEPVRRSQSAPASSPYPQGCGANPYALGAVWGLQRGYVVLPKSSTASRIESNWQIPELSKEDFDAVQKVAEGRHTRFVNMKDTFGYNVWPEENDGGELKA